MGAVVVPAGLFLFPKGKICTLDCPLDELAIFRLIMENPNIARKEIALRIEKSERTVKNVIILHYS